MKTPLTLSLAVLASAAALSSPLPGAASATPDDAPAPAPGPGVGTSAAPGVGEAPPPPPELGPPAIDERPPQLLLRGRRTQRLAPVLRAYGTCDERCEFEAMARVAGVPNLHGLRVVTPAKASDGGTRMRFEVRVSPRAEKLITRALGDGREVSVALRISAYDLADNLTERSRSIRVLAPRPGSTPLKRS
jgi:hypothetical protein